MLRCVKHIIAPAICAVFFITSLSLLSAPEARSAASAVKVVYVEGAPKIMKSGAAAWADCTPGMAIDNGDRIKTAAGEIVEVSFIEGNANMARVEPDSDVVVKKNDAPYSIELLNGSVMALMKKLPKGSSFEVRTPAGLSGARGTGWRSASEGDKASFGAFEESIYVKGIDPSGNPMADELIVESGWKTTLERFEKPEKLERLSERDTERWNSWKADVAERTKEPERVALDRAGSQAEGRLETMEARQESVNQAKDLERIEERLEEKSSSDSGSGSTSGSII